MTAATTKQFPEGMVPLGNSVFRFACHDGVACYTSCCRALDLVLYPFDVLRLKKRLGITSDAFLSSYTRLGAGAHPFFPALMMRMLEDEGQHCPFLGAGGCTVYEDRPNACRMYPLERAVDRNPARGEEPEYFFLVRHPYCLGHNESREWTVKEWVRDQRLLQDNGMSDLWTEMDTLFAANPWRGEGAAGPKQQVAFMVCYNIDTFRVYARDAALLDRFRIDRDRRRRIENDDEALLVFGYDWLKFVLGGRSSLRPR